MVQKVIVYRRWLLTEIPNENIVYTITILSVAKGQYKILNKRAYSSFQIVNFSFLKNSHDIFGIRYNYWYTTTESAL